MFHASKIKISNSAMPSINFVNTCCLKVGGVTWHGKNLHYKEFVALYDLFSYYISKAICPEALFVWNILNIGKSEVSRYKS